MAGPTPLALGPFQFQGHGFGFDGLKRNLDASWATVPVAMRFEALHWVGPKSDSVTIKGALFPHEFGGMGSLNGIASAATSGVPLMLASANGDIAGLFVIEGVTEDWTYIDANGLPGKDAYEIKLKRYAGTIDLIGDALAILGSLL